jgi:hypothetical protein
MGLLPDFTGVNSFECISERFKRSAEDIILGCHLALKSSLWTVTALELYLFTDGPLWRDEYTHQHFEQRKSGT